MPYDANAEEPYEGDDWRIYRLAWSGPFSEPKDGYFSCPWSVDMINRREIAWLRPHSYGPHHNAVIHAGTSYKDFKRLVQSVGGEIYEKVAENKDA